MKKIKVALIQASGFMDKDKTLAKMESKIREAAADSTDIIVLPEMWNCPYGTKYFREYGEYEDDSKTLRMISSLAKELGVYIFAGSVAELANDKVYNTCYAFDRNGKLIAKHRKYHLFDVDIPNKIRFMESKVLSPGEKLTVVDTEFGRIGIAVCFDVRFAGEFDIMTKQMGATIFIIPAAFNMVTGPGYWEHLMRARAVDNQAFVIACAPALDKDAPYDAFGHSCIMSPWGDVICMADFEETILKAEIDMKQVKECREQLPILNPILNRELL